MKLPIRDLALACTVLGALAMTPALQAATINQIADNAGGSNWNNLAIWGNGIDPVVNTNDYQTVAGLGTLGTSFVADGVAWVTSTNVRTEVGGNTFAGGSLLLSTSTRILGKTSGGATSSANLVFNGGFIVSAADANNSSATLAGNISFGTANIGAIGVISPGGTFTFNITSTIVGGVGDTLQLVNYGAGRTSTLNLLGDISGFAGTLYLGNATDTAVTSGTFSIQSSAPMASLLLDTATTNFQYDLIEDVTFGALTVGGTTLGNGTYDADFLNGIAPGAFIENGGSITVVPEPSTIALLGMAVILGLTPLRRRCLA